MHISGMIVGVMLLLAGCQSPGNQLASGKVVTVGKSHLVLKDADSVMFVTIQESDRQRLKGLRKGDEVTLVGKTAPEGEGSRDDSLEVDAVVLGDGTRIPLGQ